MKNKKVIIRPHDTSRMRLIGHIKLLNRYREAADDIVMKFMTKNKLTMVEWVVPHVVGVFEDSERTYQFTMTDIFTDVAYTKEQRIILAWHTSTIGISYLEYLRAYGYGEKLPGI